MRRLLLLSTSLVLLGTGPAWAHRGPAAAERALTRELAELDAREAEGAGAGTDVAAALLARAARRRELGDPAGAARDLTRASLLEGVEPAALALERARVAASAGEDGAAERLLGEALSAARPAGAVAPTRLHLDALSERAAVRTRLGALDQARADWDAAFGTRPDAESALARGALDERAGDLERAARGYRQALAVVDAPALQRALARVALARAAWDEAIAVADAALAAEAPRSDWLLLRADAHAGAGRADRAHEDRLRALAEAERALAARPSDLRRLARARVLLALGRAAEAGDEAAAVSRAHPQLDEAHLLLAGARRRAPASPPAQDPR